jgi:hypothetical protein
MVNVFLFLFVASSFEDEELLIQWQHLASEEDNNAESARESLRNAGWKFGEKFDSDLERQMISKALLIELDSAFTTHLAQHWRSFGLSDNEYVAAWDAYVDAVKEVFRRWAESYHPTTEREGLVIKQMTAKLRYIFHPTAACFVGKLPFVTPSCPQLLQRWLHDTRFAIEEVKAHPLYSFQSILTMTSPCRSVLGWSPWRHINVTSHGSMTWTTTLAASL